MPKYLRLVCEFEVEVVDPIATAAFNVDISAGDKGMRPFERHEPEAALSINRMIAEALYASAPRAGLRVVSTSTVARVQEGAEYPELTLPAVPGRRDDGSLDL